MLGSCSVMMLWLQAASFELLERLGISKEEFLAKIKAAAKSGTEKVRLIALIPSSCPPACLLALFMHHISSFTAVLFLSHWFVPFLKQQRDLLACSPPSCLPPSTHANTQFHSRSL